jgi:hypothetical protein
VKFSSVSLALLRQQAKKNNQKFDGIFCDALWLIGWREISRLPLASTLHSLLEAFSNKIVTL